MITNVKPSNNMFKSLFCIIITLFFVYGCDFIVGLKKEAKQEKELLGYINGYNPRVKEIEKKLKVEGLNSGAVDGIMDAQTRKAIKEFQKIYKIRETGFIDPQTMSKLEATGFKRAWERRQAQGHEKEQKTSSAEQIRQIQQALKKAGFYSGPIDGLMHEKTKKAIIEFQKSRGLIADGVVGKKTWEQLRKYLYKS